MRGPSGQRGDQMVRLKIVVPKTLTDEEKELFEQLSQKSLFNPREN
jgi:curved DNA-binding protein